MNVNAERAFWLGPEVSATSEPPPLSTRGATTRLAVVADELVLEGTELYGDPPPPRDTDNWRGGAPSAVRLRWPLRIGLIAAGFVMGLLSSLLMPADTGCGLSHRADVARDTGGAARPGELLSGWRPAGVSFAERWVVP